jgi:thiamine biosynthesis lipoprotein
MKRRRNNFSFMLAIGILLNALPACNDREINQIEPPKADFSDYFQLIGPIQGTSYKVIYKDTLFRNLSEQVDSLLHNYDQYLSMYVDTSVISKLNRAEFGGYCTGDEYSTEELFFECFDIAKNVYELTNGAFNPAVLPLVKAWGFIDSNSTESTINYDSLMPLIDFSKVFVTDLVGVDILNTVDSNKGVYQTSFLYTAPDGTQLDFNAIGQGHSVDVVARFLKSKGISNYMIEIGGEVRTLGKSITNEKWKLGIDKPIENSRPGEELQFIASLSGESLATSGNYRKFYIKDGVKYSHTINPHTMMPVSHNLLSVTVITDNCAEADAYATAFMVMGVDSSLNFIQSHAELNLNAYFISDSIGNYQIRQSKGFEKYIKK